MQNYFSYQNWSWLCFLQLCHCQNKYQNINFWMFSIMLDTANLKELQRYCVMFPTNLSMSVHLKHGLCLTERVKGKNTVHKKSAMVGLHYFSLTCDAIYSSKLFWFKLMYLIPSVEMPVFSKILWTLMTWWQSTKVPNNKRK